MADTLYDVEGKPIQAKEPTYYDVNGSPIKSGGVIKPPTASDTFYQNAGRFIPEGLSAIGAGVGSTVGGFGGPIGAGAGSLVGNALKHLAPSLFGAADQSNSPEEYLANTGSDIFTNSVLPELGGKLASGVVNTGAAAVKQGLPGLISKFKGVSPSIKISMEGDRVAGNASELTNRFLQDPELNTLPRGGNKPSALAPKDFTTPYNEAVLKGSTETQDLIHTGFSPTSGALDPTKILDNLAKKPESYSNIDPITKNNLKEFLTTVKDQKPFADLKAGESPYIRYFKHRLVFEIPSMVAGGMAGHTALTGAAVGTIELGEAAIKKLMSDPNFAKLTIQAAKTPASSPAAPLIGRAIMHGIQGIDVYITSPDGDRVKGTVNEKGQLQRTEETQ